jgi:hypothetical protein
VNGRHPLLLAFALVALPGAIAPAAAHELDANRVTVVQRDERHLSLSFHIDLAAALHRAIAPRLSFQEFVLAHAAMKPQDLSTTLRPALRRFEASTRLSLTEGRAAPTLHWRWPDDAQVQALLQQHAMRLVVAPADHTHVEPTEVRAEWQASADIARVALQLPPEFGSVLVVSYRPRQAWLRPQSPALPLTF